MEREQVVTEVKRQAELEKEIAVQETKKKKWVSAHVYMYMYMYNDYTNTLFLIAYIVRLLRVCMLRGYITE